MIDRRHFLALGAATSLVPVRAWTQQPARLPKVGILSPNPPVAGCGPDQPRRTVCYFIEGMRDLGYVEGRNVAYEYRFADGDSGRIPALARELVALRPDVIWTHTGWSADALARATTTIPIVVGPAGEVTLTRLAGNLARPTGNVTGTTANTIGQDEKCLQLLQELDPRSSRVAVLFNPDNFDFRGYPGVLAAAATQAGMTLIDIEIRNASDLPPAFAAITTGRANAILLTGDPALTANDDVRQQIIKWASGRRLPLASPGPRVAPGGGLVSLSTDLQAPARRAAFYVHRVLGGAKPAELPVERPTTYKLSVNKTTAAALGLTIPQSVRLRADEVIE